MRIPWAMGLLSLACLNAGAESAPSGASVPELLDRLRRNPSDPGLLAALNRSAAAAASGGAEEERRRDLDAPERRMILRQAYLRLIAGVGDDSVREIFLQGHTAFEKGQYLLAADRFELVRLLNPPQPWLKKALNEYLAEQIPAAAARARGGASSAPYQAAYRALTSGRWAEALAAVERLESSGLSPSSSLEREEVEELRRRIDERLAIDDSPEARETRLADALSGVSRSPGEAAASLEALLCRFGGQSREAWWQKTAEGLRLAYFDWELQKWMTDADADYARRDFKSATRRLVAVLQKAPGHPPALELIERMDRRLADAEAPRPSAPPPPPAAASPPAAPVAAAPTLKDALQAEAYYNRGLQSYLQGDLRRAMEEWRRAAALNPGHEKAGKALSRVIKEIAVTQKDPGR